MNFGMMDSPWLPLLIFLARIGDVSIGTMRIICVTRGQRSIAVILGFFEIMIWVFAAAGVFTRLDRLANVAAYAAGFAAGNAVGMWLESRIALGINAITLISNGKAHAVAERLRLAEFPVTSVAGTGLKGAVAVCYAVVPRKMASSVIRMAREIDPDVFATVEDVRETTAYRPSLSCLGAGKTPLPRGRPFAGRLENAFRGFFAHNREQNSCDDEESKNSEVPGP